MKWPGKKNAAPQDEEVFEDDDDFEFERIGLSDEKPAGKFRRIILILFLLVAVGGVAWWYLIGSVQQADDAQLPVIRAELGPIKVKPKNPGGMEIPNRDKLVYERLGTNPGAPMVERLLPEPEKPLPMPKPEPDPEVKPEVKPEESVKTAESEAKPPASAPIKLEPQAVEPVKPAPVAAPPKIEPKPVVETKAAQPKPVVVGSKVYKIQLAAVRSEDAAVNEWKRISKKHPELMGRLSLMTQRADLGAQGIFYRIQAGPLADEAAAKKLCADLAAKKVGCLVVRP